MFITPVPGDHQGWAVYWGAQALASYGRCLDTPRPTTQVDFDLEHLVRSTRMAFYHASRLMNYQYWLGVAEMQRLERNDVHRVR